MAGSAPVDSADRFSLVAGGPFHSVLRLCGLIAADIGRSYRAIAYSRRFARPNEDIDPGADDPWSQHVEYLAAFLREIDVAPAH